MTMSVDSVQTFKILIIGDPDVGKTSMMNRLVYGVFTNKYAATIGVDFKIVTINIGTHKCRLQIWDTAGQERYRAMTSSYFRGADGVIIVYDVMTKESFSNVKSRLPEIDSLCDASLPRILVGNKNDDEQQKTKVISTQNGEELAKENGLLFFETSVKDNRNINEVFHRMTTLVLERRLAQSKTKEKKIVLNETPSLNKKPTNQCCSG